MKIFEINRRKAVIALSTAVVAVIISLTVYAGLSSQRSSQAARIPISIGMNMHPLWNVFTDAEEKTYIDKLADAKVQWIRVDVGWDNIFPSGPNPTGTGSIAETDKVINYASSKGIKVLMVWYRTPGWANGNKGVEVCPTNNADYANSAKWAAANWKGRVQAFEIWNEPDPAQPFWRCSQDQYAALLKAAYPAIKLGNPEAKVVMGAPTYNNDTWLKGLYERGVKSYFDVMATHPYPGIASQPPETADKDMYQFSHQKSVVAMMKTYGDENKEFWFTEYGYSTHDKFSNNNWEQGVTEQQQADYSIRAIQYANDNFPKLTNIFFYDIRDRTAARTVHEAKFGMFRTDGSAKPFYASLKTFLSAYYGPLTDTTKPTATIIAPTAGTTTVIGTAVSVTASASDNIKLAKVEILVDNTVRTTLTTAPYSYTWSTTGVSAGAHTLAARAYDSAGNVSGLTTVSVTLTAAAPSAILGDANGDKRVNSLDLSIVISQDGKSFPAADFNKDGLVGAADMAILLSKWTW